MQIDLEHLHYWMCALRGSENPTRTLDAFWRGQLRSKEWLIDCLDEHVHVGSSVDIHGGWVGVLYLFAFWYLAVCTTNTTRRNAALRFLE